MTREVHEAGIVSPWVFPDEEGSPTSQRKLLTIWDRYCKHNGIAKITLYELRHTNYSVNKEMPESYKKMLFGHSADFNGDAVYSHAIDGDLRAAAAMNEAAFLKIIRK